MEPNTPEYWKTFYIIQAALLVECPNKYTPKDTSTYTSPLNNKAHEMALSIHNIYEKV